MPKVQESDPGTRPSSKNNSPCRLWTTEHHYNSASTLATWHVIEEKRIFPTAETNWNWFSNPRQLNTLLDPALKSGRFMSFTLSNLPSSKRVLWRIFVPLFSSSFLFLTSRYSCLGAMLSCVPTFTNLSLSLCHHIMEFQAYDGSASSLFNILHPQSIISSKFCFVGLFGLNLMTKQFLCFWSLESSHFPFPMQILKKSISEIRSHFAQAAYCSVMNFSNFLSWPLNKTCKLREPCDMCLDHGREASLGNLLVTPLFLQGVNET